MNNIRIFTDASFKDGVSTHHWRVVNDKQKVIKRRTFKSTDLNNNDAELTSIISAIQWIEKKGYKKVTIFTDSKNCVDKLNGESDKDSIKYVQWLLKGSKIKIKWRGSKHYFIKQADKSCKELLKNCIE